MIIDLLKQNKIKEVYYYQINSDPQKKFETQEYLYSYILDIASCYEKKIKFFNKKINHISINKKYKKINLEINYKQNKIKFILIKIINLLSEIINYNKKKSIALIGFNIKKVLYFYRNLLHFKVKIIDGHKESKNITIMQQKEFSNNLEKIINEILKFAKIKNKTAHKILVEFYYEIYIFFIKKFYLIYHDYILRKKILNYKGLIVNLELPIENYINILFSNNQTRSLILSHGGTIGHFIDFPTVWFFSSLSKKIKYQVFSKELKKRIIKNNLLNTITKKNFHIIPSYDLIKFKQSCLFKSNNIKKNNINVCYVASANDEIYDLKQKNQAKKTLEYVRNAVLKIFYDNPKINFFIKQYENEKFTYDLNLEKYQNIKIISVKSFSEINKNFDLFIFETVSTALIETLLLNKKIICLKPSLKLDLLFEKKFSQLHVLAKNPKIFLKKIKDELKNKSTNKKILDDQIMDYFYDKRRLKSELFFNNLIKFFK